MLRLMTTLFWKASFRETSGAQNLVISRLRWLSCAVVAARADGPGRQRLTQIGGRGDGRGMRVDRCGGTGHRNAQMKTAVRWARTSIVIPGAAGRQRQSVMRCRVRGVDLARHGFNP